MRALAVILWLGALLVTATAQPFGALTAVPTHPAPGIALNWVSGPSGTVIINRAPLGFPPVPIAMTTGTTYTDTTGAANTLYSYSVSQASSQSNLATAVVSDTTQPFNCPFYAPVDPSLFGVDRTETFQSADGSTVSFTIHAPVPGTFVSNVGPPCNGAGGCSDATNISNALAAVKANGRGTAQLQSGVYDCDLPFPSGCIDIVSNPDLILAGVPYTGDVPSTIIKFRNVNSTTIANGLAIISQRVLVRDIGLDWNIPNALPGVVTTVGGVQRLTVSNPSFYIPDPTHPPGVFAITGYNLGTGTFTLQTGARPGVGGTFNTNFAMDGLYYYALPAGTWFPEGSQAIGWVKTGAVIQIANGLDTSFENVRIYGGGGPGISAVSTGSPTGNIRLTNFKITKKPASLLAPGEPARFVSVYGDNDLNSTNGNLLIENSEFAFIDDDFFAFGGGFGHQMTSIVSTTEFTYQSASKPILHPTDANDVFAFFDPVTLAPLGSAPALSWTQTLLAGTWTLDVTLATPVPGLAPYVGTVGTAVPLATDVGWGNPNFVIRNTCAHDGHGRFLVGSGRNGLFDSNTLANSFFGPISMFWAPTFLAQVGANNIIVRGHNLVGNGYGLTDTTWFGAPSFGLQTGPPAAAISIEGITADGFYALSGRGVSRFQIYDNFISNFPGVAILSAGAYDVGIVHNKIVDANAIPFQSNYQTLYCDNNPPYPLNLSSYSSNYVCFAKVAGQGSIMATHSDNVDDTSTANIFLGTSQGLFSDTPTLLHDNIVGSKFIH